MNNIYIFILTLGIFFIQVLSMIVINGKLDEILNKMSSYDIIEEKEPNNMDIFRNMDGLYTNKKVKPNEKH